MLYDPARSRDINFSEHEGKLIICIPVRGYLDIDNWAKEIHHGEEGVWYRPAEDRDNQFELIVPIHQSDFNRIYELKPRLCAPINQTRQHRWLIRYWDDSVYVPTTQSTIISLIEYYEGPWGLIINNFSIRGYFMHENIVSNILRE